MKTIAIFCADLELGGATFEHSHYWQAYLDLLLLIQSRGVEAYFVTNNASYLGAGVFAEGHTIFKAGLPADLLPVPFIKADLVFDRGGFSGTDIPVVNPAQVFQLGADKTLMYQIFGEFQAHSVICHTRNQLEAALDEINTELVVVKDPLGSGGTGVHIGRRAEVLANLAQAEYPLLAQEFMDTSVGIPGVTAGTHDLRFVLVGGEVVSCDIRTPKAGEYRANVSQGGSVKYLSPEQFPRGAVQLAKHIDTHFGAQPRFYAIDLAHTTEGWKLIELNAWPGIIPARKGLVNAEVLRKLTAYLVSLVRGKQPLGAPAEVALHAVSSPLPQSNRITITK